MSGRWELAILCWTLSVLRYAFSLVATAKEIQVGNQIEFNAQFKWIIILVLAVGAVNDILIAAGLSLFLSKSRSGITTYAFLFFLETIDIFVKTTILARIESSIVSSDSLFVSLRNSRLHIHSD